MLVCIDEDKLKSEVRYEDGDNCGREYPHVYGLINNDAVIKVLPFLKQQSHYLVFCQKKRNSIVRMCY